jgi:hypothetical protein
LAASRRWAAANFEGESQAAAEPFFSFTYNDKPSAAIHWPRRPALRP